MCLFLDEVVHTDARHRRTERKCVRAHGCATPQNRKKIRAGGDEKQHTPSNAINLNFNELRVVGKMEIFESEKFTLLDFVGSALGPYDQTHIV